MGAAALTKNRLLKKDRLNIYSLIGVYGAEKLKVEYAAQQLKGCSYAVAGRQ
jgi:hypothetical protein